jgi:23S rRNA-/tRNA-specific pseudouridylate synthase
VVGDRLYGENKSPLGLNRQFLHASMLNIELPSGERKEFKAPLASDLKQYLKSIE